MSKSATVITRPKVRFSEFPDNLQNKAADEQCKDKVTQQATGPRITSIVSLKKPIKIVDPKKLNAGNKTTSGGNSVTEISPHCSGAVSEGTQSASQPCKNVPKAKTAKILHNNGDNTKGSNNVSQINKKYQGAVPKDYKSNVQQKGKENKDCKHRTVTKSRSAPNIKSSYKVAKPRAFSIKSTSSLMPCYKAMLKTSPAKKMVLRDVSGSKIKTSVEPGIYHAKTSKKADEKDTKIDDADKRCTIASSAEELAQPKYNSIMCTIDKLKEYQQQKLVPDINHLSAAQKHIVNGKVSTALDFPLDEILYKNLVDLSIAEQELPPPLTRNKDPKPRRKDVTLKLSDFFTPENTNEFYEVVQVKPRMPKLVENWNAFKISDMIHEWKHRLDDI